MGFKREEVRKVLPHAKGATLEEQVVSGLRMLNKYDPIPEPPPIPMPQIVRRLTRAIPLQPPAAPEPFAPDEDHEMRDRIVGLVTILIVVFLIKLLIFGY
jgi:hypothetical protein